MALFKKRPDIDPDLPQKIAAEVQVVDDVLQRYGRSAVITFAAPTRCPHCGDYGFVESVDHAAGSCSNLCTRCKAQWTITRRALKRVRERAELAPATPEPSGVLLRPSQPAGDVMGSPGPEPPLRSHRPPPPLPAPPALAARLAPSGGAPSATGPGLSAVATPAGGDPPIRLLVAEANPFDLAVIETVAEPGLGDRLDLVSVSSLSDAIKATGRGVDAALVNLSLPDSSDDAMATILRWQHATDPAIPLLVLSDGSNPELVSQAKALGVAHVILHDQIADLAEDPDKGCTRLVQLLKTTIRKHAQTPRPVSSAEGHRGL
jgi:CheY-like chemotaxis protein